MWSVIPAAQALADWPLAQRARIRGVLTDIDDTLTENGALAPEARDALARLQAAGLPVIAVTGRPAGWSEPFALDWPLAAIVAENGAVLLWREADGRLGKDWLQDAATRARNRQTLSRVAGVIAQTLPQARLATDSAGRETDLAIDHAEHAHLDAADIAQVCRLMRAHGLQATVSSIHINGWVGEHHKWVGACWALQRLYGRSLAQEIESWVYIGDSPNDEIMFAHCPHSVAVANILPQWASLQHHPRYVTPSPRGAGFAEMVAALLG